MYDRSTGVVRYEHCNVRYASGVLYLSLCGLCHQQVEGIVAGDETMLSLPYVRLDTR